MYICRLFHRDRPFEQIDARLLSEGGITIGRDPASDWPLDCADGALSRRHCTLSLRDGRLFLCDWSTNGTFLEDGKRAPPCETIELKGRQTLRLGALSLLVERMEENAVGDPVATTVQTPRTLEAQAQSTAPPPLHRDASLLSAFCDGARLDVSVLASEDPREMIQRVGEVYRAMVVGLSTLMSDRARLKSESRLDRTTLGAQENNPFKWTAPRQLAEDLVLGEDRGFLTAAEAVEASFKDLAKHLAGVTAGADAAVGFVTDVLSPTAIESDVESRASLLRGRSAICWDAYRQKHAALSMKDEPFKSGLAKAFGDGYNSIANAPPH